MISNFLVKTFVKNSEDIKNSKVRNSYGTLGGMVGIIVNTILFAIKFIVGLLVGSIAISADAFNNLSDAASSVITIIGFKLANKPPDKEHPFGHGRIEYLSALLVAFLVIFVGFEFTKTSFNRILNPSPVTFEIIPFIFLLISIFFKLWLALFNKNIGNKINSGALKAASTDALGDVFTSSTVVISFLLSKFISFPIDGYMGLIVAIAILIAGIKLVKETLNPLLGEAPDKELVNNIKAKLLSYPEISGYHDLIIHNYGHGRILGTVHAEIPSDMDIIEIHEVIDKVEREISKELNMHLVIHMDPIYVMTEEMEKTYNFVNDLIESKPETLSFHDFRASGKEDNKTLYFDIVIDHKLLNTEESIESLLSDLKSQIKDFNPKIKKVLIVVDYYDFV